MGDVRTTTGQPPPATPRERRRRRFMTILIVTLVLVTLASAGLYIKVNRYALCSGYVTTEEYAEVRPAMVGTVAEILVRTGSAIGKGDVMVRLDASEELASIEEAKSRVHKVEAEVARRQAEIAERKRELAENIAIAKLRLQNASAKLLRTQELLTKGLVAGSALEDDKLKEELGRAELTSLMSKDQSIYGKELAVLHQDLEATQEVVKRLEARIRSKEIRAPVAGQVLRYEFVIGELVRPESVLFEIFGGEKQVLKLRVGERYATRVAEGQEYEAQLSSYRGIQRIYFRGKVNVLRNAIQMEAQKSYRVAYCSFDPQGYGVPPGTTAEAKIFYGKSCLWLYLFGLD